MGLKSIGYLDIKRLIAQKWHVLEHRVSSCKSGIYRKVLSSSKVEHSAFSHRSLSNACNQSSHQQGFQSHKPLPQTSTSSIILTLVIKRLPCLRTNFQHPRHPVQQPLVLRPLPALQQLDIIRLRIHLLRQLRLRHLIRPLFRASLANSSSNLGT